MNFRKALVAVGATIAVALSPIAFPSIATATPSQQSDIYGTNTSDTSSSSNAYDYVSYGGHTYFSVQTAEYGRAIYSVSAPGQEPQLISHTDEGMWVGTSNNIFVKNNYLFYTNKPTANSATKTYVVNLDTNTTSVISNDGEIRVGDAGFGSFNSVGDKVFFLGDDNSHTRTLFSFDTTNAAVSPVTQLPFTSIRASIQTLDSKLIFDDNSEDHFAYSYDTANDTWSAPLTNASGNVLANAKLYGSVTYLGQDAVIVGTAPYGYGFYHVQYTALFADGTKQALGTWESFYDAAKFVNLNGNLYVSYWTWEDSYLARIDDSGNKVNVNSTLAPEGGTVRINELAVTNGNLVFTGGFGSDSGRIYRWDGSGAAVRVTDTVLSSNGFYAEGSTLGVLGNNAIASTFLSDSDGPEPYIFGFDGTVTLTKNFSTLTNGYDPYTRCAAAFGDTVYFVGSTPTVDPAKAGGIVTIFKAGNSKLAYSTVHVGGDVSGNCGFALINSETYFVDNNRMLTKISADGTVTELFTVQDYTLDPAYTDGANYYFYVDTRSSLHRVDLAAQSDQTITGPGTDVDNFINYAGAVTLNGVLYFSAASIGTYETNLWSLDLRDPTATPVIAARNLMPGTLTAWDNKVLFNGSTDGDYYSVYMYNPADSSTTILGSLSVLSEQADRFANIGGTLYVHTSNLEDYVSRLYKYVAGSGLVELNLGVTPACIAQAGQELAVSDQSGNLYFFDNAGNLQKEEDGLLSSDALCNSIQTDHGTYLVNAEYLYGGATTYGRELAYLGPLTPAATSRLGVPVAELPSQPFTGAPPVADTEIPGVPSNVTGAAVDGNINLAWDAPTSGGPVRDYTVTATPNGPVCTTDGPTASCTGAVAGTTYTFKVAAVNTAGASALSGASAGIVGPLVAVKPTIAGNVRLTQTVTANTSGWSAGTTFTYQWFKHGSPISGATAATYRIANGDLGHKISVQVTGSKAGLASRTFTSADYKVGTAVVTLFGTARIGSTLTVDPGIWPSGTTLSYQWRVNSYAVGWDPTYTISKYDALKRITVAVTGQVNGRDVTKLSNGTSQIPLARFAVASVPTLSGDNFVYGQVCADPNQWDNNAYLQYTWYRNGRKIDWYTDSCYSVQESDFGQRISVKVSGSDTGYVTTERYSSGMKIVRRDFDAWLSNPRIYGTPVVGNTLEAYLGNLEWTGANFTYQWLDNGKAIGGATNSTYTVERKRLGHKISLRVTLSQQYYNTKKFTSNETRTVTN